MLSRLLAILALICASSLATAKEIARYRVVSAIDDGTSTAHEGDSPLPHQKTTPRA